MKYLIVILLSTFMFNTSNTDSLNETVDEEAAVRATIEMLFDGMKESDGNKVKAAFSENAIMKTIGRDENGNAVVQDGSLDSFVQTVSSFEPGMLNEKILNYTIQIDGPLASAWTPYEFYRGEEFSHCGVNSFQLVKSGDDWKIVYIIDTRRREGCK